MRALRVLLKATTSVVYKIFWKARIQKKLRTRAEKAICVLLNSGIGDSIIALPLIHDLARRGYLIYALANENTAAVTRLCPAVADSIVIDERQRRRPFMIRRRMKAIAHDIKPFALIGALPSNRLLEAFLPLWLSAPVRIKHKTPQPHSSRNFDFLYSHLIDRDEERHNVESNMDLLKALGLNPGSERTFDLALKDSLKIRIKEKIGPILGEEGSGPIVGMHIGCKDTWSFKRWPPDRFAELADRLVRLERVRIALFGGADEKNLGKQLEDRLRSAKPINLIGRLLLEETIAAISSCRLFVSNDSGLMHVATTFKIPVIGLFGERSDSRQIGPYGTQQAIIQKKNLSDITVDEVFARAVDILSGVRAAHINP